jgi:hypothetical protein
MAETKLVVDNREQLWTLLVEAAQIEHMIMCQSLYACSSLKAEPDEGLTAEQADAVTRWQETLTGIAIEEMLHLALITNVMTAIGAGPTLARPNFPRHSEYLPPGVEFALLPFGADSLTHFLYLERPEGMERADAAEFVPAAPPPAPVAGARRRLGTAVRTGGHTVPTVRGNRQACRSSRRGQLSRGGRCGDRAADRRVRAG